MDQAEASGKTVEDALNRALAILGARRDEVEFTVLDEGAKGGLFKRGRDAIVRVDRIAGQAAPVPLQLSSVVFAGTTSRISTPSAGSFPLTL